MLNLSTKQIHNCPIIRLNCRCKSIFQRPTTANRIMSIYMTDINIADEETLKHGEPIYIERDGIKFSIDPRNVYCYGETDFEDENSEDLEYIDTFNWFDCLVEKGVMIPSNYDYKTHTAISDLKIPRWTETFSPAKVTQLVHGMLGKPKRIIIFSHVS